MVLLGEEGYGMNGIAKRLKIGRKTVQEIERKDKKVDQFRIGREKDEKRRQTGLKERRKTSSETSK